MVAALAEHANLKRRVWIDVFTVRQWPGNDADLNFTGVIERCTSFFLVCASLDSVTNMDQRLALKKDISQIPDRDRKKIAFYRVWCLVEIAAACEMMKKGKMNIVMKCVALQGIPKTQRDLLEGKLLVENKKMMARMSEVVDVRRAEATVEADREKIMSKLGKNCIELNRIVRATCLGARSAMGCPQISAAACGDLNVKSVRQFLSENPSQAFYVAAGGGFLNVIKFLYEVVGSQLLSRKCKENRTALVRASIGGHVSIVKFLLEKSSNERESSNVVDKSGMTPLLYASANGHVDVMGILIDAGADMRYSDRINGTTALIEASRKSHLDAVELLLRRGADVNQECMDRQTALIAAAKLGHVGVVRSLLKYGADTSHKDDSNRNALLWARKKDHGAVVQELLSNGGKDILKMSVS